MMNIIETDQLRKVYQTPRGKNREMQTVEAVKGIDLQVGEGEIFGFLGPNGAGKTTSLHFHRVDPDR